MGVVPLHRGEAEVAEGAPAPPARGVEALEERESPPAPVERQHVHEAMAKDRFVPPVSGEQLIAAVAREGHRDLPAREFGDQVRGNQRGVRERFVERGQKPLDGVDSRELLHLLVVLGPVLLGDEPRVSPLVERGLREADRIGLGRAARDPRDRRDDRARIHASAQEGTDVALQMASDRVLDRAAQAVGESAGARLLVDVRSDVPVPRVAHGAVGLGHEKVAREELADPPEDRERIGDVRIGEKRVQRDGIDLTGRLRIGEDRLQLRSEQERPIAERRIVERLDADPVPRQDEPPAGGIEERDREHPSQLLDEALAPLLVEMDDHFGVRARREAVAAGLEALAQEPMVVDLAVENDADVPLLVEDGRIARREVDDPEPPHPEAAPSVEVMSFAVGTTMEERPDHLDERRPALVGAEA